MNAWEQGQGGELVGGRVVDNTGSQALPTPTRGGSLGSVSLRGNCAAKTTDHAAKSKPLSDTIKTCCPLLRTPKERGARMSSASSSTLVAAKAPSRRDKAPSDSAQEVGAAPGVPHAGLPARPYRTAKCGRAGVAAPVVGSVERSLAQHTGCRLLLAPGPMRSNPCWCAARRCTRTRTFPRQSPTRALNKKRDMSCQMMKIPEPGLHKAAWKTTMMVRKHLAAPLCRAKPHNTLGGEAVRACPTNFVMRRGDSVFDFAPARTQSR